MRKNIIIDVTVDDRARLEAIVADRNRPQKHVWRANIILLTDEGAGTAAIQRRTGKSKICVWRWQERFMHEGVDGLLRDKTRPARKAPLAQATIDQVVELSHGPPPFETTHWTALAMAETVGISVSSVQRIWRAHGLQPHRVRQFKLSKDPAFVAKLREKVDAMVMGDPLDEKTDIGTIISPEQFAKVKSYIDHGKGEAGAEAIECSAMPTDEKFKDGLFVRPVVFLGMTNESKLAREEIFGPVTCVIKWTDEEEVLAAANDSDYGLAATVWTNDLKAALNFTEKLEAGFVQVNQNLVVQPGLSYGGVKQSGIGKEATLEAMLEHFTKKKTIIFNKT